MRSDERPESRDVSGYCGEQPSIQHYRGAGLSSNAAQRADELDHLADSRPGDIAVLCQPYRRRPATLRQLAAKGVGVHQDCATWHRRTRRLTFMDNWSGQVLWLYL